MTTFQLIKNKMKTPIYLSSPNKREMAMLMKQLSTMVQVGIPIHECFEVLQDQKWTPRMRVNLETIDERLIKGYSIFEALEGVRFPNASLLQSMVMVGENTGKLGEILEDLSHYYQRQYTFEGKIRQAMFYPVILVMVSLGVVMFALNFILPTFVTLFEGTEQVLPLQTRILIQVSNWMTQHGSLLLLSLFVLITGIVVLRKIHPPTRMLGDAIKYRLPIIGRMMKLSSCEKISTSMSILLAAGVPMHKVLQITSSGVHNQYLLESLKDIEARVLRGESLSSAFSHHHFFPPMLLSMTKVGEETGKLAEIMKTSATYYEEDLEYNLLNATKLLEPLLLIIISLVIGFIVLAVAVPMFDMVNYVNIN